MTLIGLISKHGILMVDYANQLQEDEGLSRREAIEKAAAIRLRPILMTTAAMVVGMVPLFIASGAGAASRFSIGLVIAAGMTDRHAVHAVRDAGGLHLRGARALGGNRRARRCRPTRRPGGAPEPSGTWPRSSERQHVQRRFTKTGASYSHWRDPAYGRRGWTAGNPNHMHILLRGDFAAARIASGLILFAFAATHFLNHALGLVNIETDARGAAVALGRHPLVLGTFVLLMALLMHIALALYKLANRSTLRLPPWELVQIALGLLIPFLLFPHIVNTRVAHVFFGVEDNYLYELARLWPASALLQSTLLVLVWLHGCIGIHYWLRLYPPYRAAQPVLLFIAIAVPLASLGGFMVVGARRGAADREPGDVRAREGADRLAERCRRRRAGRVPADWSGSASPASCCWSPPYRLALLRAEHAAEDVDHVHRRADGQGAGRPDAARDQPHARHPARVRVRRSGALLDLPRAHRRGRRRRCPPGLSRGRDARQHRRAAERASGLPGAARAAR